MRAVRVTFMLATLAFAACGDSGPTRGAQCREVMTAFCDRAGGECQQFTAAEIPSCIEAGTSTCCAGNCNAHVVSTQQEIDTCKAALQTATCASLDVQNGGTLPAVCFGVVRSALMAGETSAFGTTESNADLVGRLLSH